MSFNTQIVREIMFWGETYFLCTYIYIQLYKATYFVYINI